MQQFHNKLKQDGWPKKAITLLRLVNLIERKAEETKLSLKLKFFPSMILVNKKIPPIGLAHLSVPNKNKMSKSTEEISGKLATDDAGNHKWSSYRQKGTNNACFPVSTRKCSTCNTMT